MATTKGQAIAAPQIFGSDPIEQTYAKGTLDPDMGGLAYAYMTGARGHREQAQATYLDALRESNMMASRLAQQEMDTGLLETLLKTAAEHANAGISPATIPATSKMYSDRFGELTNLPASLSRDKKAAEAEKLRAEAAHAGDAGADTLTVTQQVGPGGTPGETTFVGKGKNPARVTDTVRAQAARPGGPGALNPDGSVPTTPQVRAQVPGVAGPVPVPPGAPGATVGVGSNARAQGEAKRQAEAKARAEAQRTQRQLQQVQ